MSYLKNHVTYSRVKLQHQQVLLLTVHKQSDQFNQRTNLCDATNVTLNIKQKLVDHRLRTIEMQMSQNMHILQAQQM